AAFEAGRLSCPWQYVEDYFLSLCLDFLGVVPRVEHTLLIESVFWNQSLGDQTSWPCWPGYVAYHPKKKSTDYVACLEEASSEIDSDVLLVQEQQAQQARQQRQQPLQPPQQLGLTADDKLHLLYSKYNLSERIDGPRLDTRAANASVVVVVTHRELVIGCHDFERFLSPDFDTWFVFEKSFARAWGLDSRVRSPQLLHGGSAHLLLTDVVTGEVHARSAVISILQQEAAQRNTALPEFMYSTMCDIQPLPGWHSHHVPFPDMVSEMVRALSEEKARRKLRQGSQVQDVAAHRDSKFERVNASCFHSRPEDRANLPILTMNNAILETLPQMDSIVGATLHGHDVGHFIRQGGLESAKPWLENGAPRKKNASEAPVWLSDVSTFVEDHSILYDLALYLQFDENSIFELLQQTPGFA
ncbi:unnamed protein product, partial [Polarella glacialis]